MLVLGAAMASAGAACSPDASSPTDDGASWLPSGNGGGDGKGGGHGRGGGDGEGGEEPGDLDAYGVLFVTQVPVAGFNVVTSTFGNHVAGIKEAPRGGDLWIRYDDGELRNLTEECGFGSPDFQGDAAIAVREPSVDWHGRKALFSMVVGAATEQYERQQYRWQVYEIEGLQQGDRATITKVDGQPADYDNVAPFYGTDGRILFVSDRPRNGDPTLYPQLDEYESTPVVVGLYSLDPKSGDLFLVNHATSGILSPFIDSFGRVVYTKWDHLQRDQQEEADRLGGAAFGAFDFADESGAASRLGASETFPEARSDRDPNLESGVSAHTFNQFFPWQILEDGREEETLNHAGRHELGGSYGEGSFLNDPNLTYKTPQSTHDNRVYVGDDGGFFQMVEDPAEPGTYYAINAQEFGTETSGQLLRFNGGVGVNPDHMVITELTPVATRTTPASPPAEHTGHYRDPLPRHDGELWISHTDATNVNANLGSVAGPSYPYAFRIKTIDKATGALGAPVTTGIHKAITWWSPDVMASWEGDLWELDAVEVGFRKRPKLPAPEVPAPEQRVLDEEGVSAEELRAWLVEQGLALIVSRNVTARDRADVQQPFNLSVPGGVSTVATDGAVYDVSHLQIFQADQVRGYESQPGRRPLARALHEEATLAYLDGSGPEGSARIAVDGSMAALVPARRAMTWQLTDPDGEAVVRERAWVSFAPGEIRVCASCHGINTADQVGRPPPENPPEALRTLVRAWRTNR